ncbi:Beta-galactosidase [Orobanche minor]
MASTSIARSNVAVKALQYRLPHSPKTAIISLTPGLGESRPSAITYTHNRTANGSSIPIIRAQSSSAVDYVPDANFYKVEAILRPWRIPQVSSKSCWMVLKALLKIGIRGVTVSDVRGFGAQGGSTERQAVEGSEFSEDNFVMKVKMEIVVGKDQVEEVIEKIVQEARTGEIGDGKIFLTPVSDIIRVRTGERGEKAERMMGGRADMFSGGSSASLEQIGP